MAEPLALFALELCPPSLTCAATSGHFTERDATDAQDLVLIRQGSSYGSILECWSYRSSLGTLQRKEARGLRAGTCLEETTFANVWNIATWHTVKGPDHLLVVADTGTISLLTWSTQPVAGSSAPGEAAWPQSTGDVAGVVAGWVCLASAVIGKPGARANRPGSFLAVDERGQACVIAALDGTSYAFTLHAGSAEKAPERSQSRRRNRTRTSTGHAMVTSTGTLRGRRSTASRRSYRRRKRTFTDAVDASSEGPETDSNDEDDVDGDFNNDQDHDHDDDLDDDEFYAPSTCELSALIECTPDERFALGISACLGLVPVPGTKLDDEPCFVMLADCVAHASDTNSMQRQRQVNDRRLVLLQVDCNAQTMQQGVASEPLARHAYALYPLAEAMLLVVTLSTMEIWQVTNDAETTTTTSATTTTTNWLFTKTFRCMGTIAIPTKASPAMSPGTTCGALARGSFFDLPPTETRPERAQHVLVTAAIFWQAASTADHLQILIGDEDGHIFLLTMDRSASSLERPQAALKLKLLERMPAPVSAFCFLTATDVFLVLERGDHVVIHLQWPFADDQVDIAATSSMSASQSSGTTLEPVQDFAIKAQGMEPMSAVRSVSIRDSMACHHPVTTSLLVQPIHTGLADEERAHPQWHLLCGSAGSGPADSNLWTAVPARDTVALAQCPVGGRAQRLFTLPMNPGETNANESSVADSNQSWSTRNDDALLLISFTQETRVFRFHALALREERELGFERETGTIHASVLFGGEPATPYWLQVHTNGVRLVASSSSKERTLSDIEVYATNAQQHIVAADSTVSQLLLLLADGQLVYLVSADAAWPDATGPASTDGTTPTPMNVVFGPPGATTKKATGQRTRTTSATDLSVAPSPTLHAMACCLSPPQDSWSPLMAYVEAGNPVTLRICRLPKKTESASAQCICSVALPQPAASLAMVHLASHFGYDVWAGLEDGTLLRLEAVDLDERKTNESASASQMPRIRSYGLGRGALQLRRVRVPTVLGSEAILVLGSRTWLVPLVPSTLWSNPYRVNVEALMDAASFPLPQGGTTIDADAETEAIAVFPAATALVGLSSDGRALHLFAFSEAESIRNWLAFHVVGSSQPSASSSTLDATHKCIRKLCWIIPNRLAAVAYSVEHKRGWQTHLSLLCRHRTDHVDASSTTKMPTSPWILLDGVTVNGELAWPGGWVTTLTSMPVPRQVSETKKVVLQEHLLVVGLAPAPASSATSSAHTFNEEMKPSSNALLITFSVQRQGEGDASWKLAPVDRQSFPEQISAVSPFLSHLAVAWGGHLALYARTSRGWQPLTQTSRPLPHSIVALATNEDTRRLFVADLREGVYLFKYYPQDNRLAVVAEDTQRRWIHRLQVLDADTVVAADKFGTIFVLRLPLESSAAIEDDPSRGHLADRYFGHPQLSRPFVARFTTECVFHAGSVATSLHVFGAKNENTDGRGQRRPLDHGPEGILYSTVNGAFGALVPFRSYSEWEMLKRLESEMDMYWAKQGTCAHPSRGLHQWNLLHSSVVRFYGGIEPKRHVVSGQLCGLFALLDAETQESIAGRVLGLQEPIAASEARRAVALLLVALGRLHARAMLCY